MQFKEGGTSTSNLADYVSGVFTQRTQQEAEALRLKEAADQVRLEQFIQKTSPLRDYLLQLAAPIEELIASFRVRELLEEAGTILNSHGCGEYVVRDLRPWIYEQVVLHPQPTESIQLEDGTIDLNAILDQDNFRETVPQLEGYGLTLSFESRVRVPTVNKKQVWVPPSTSHFFHGPEASSGQTPGYWSWDDVSAYAPTKVVKGMGVAAIKSVSETTGHDLLYVHIMSRRDLRSGEKLYPEDRFTYLTPPTRIEHDDQAGTLQRLIGDDIVREIDGGYKNLLHQYLTEGTRKTFIGIVRERGERIWIMDNVESS